MIFLLVGMVLDAVIYGQEIGMRLREINKVSDKPRDKYSPRDT